MRILKLNQKNFKEIIKEATQAIQEGKIVVCPTDTLYGLIADARDIKAVKKASGKIAVSSVKFLGRSIWFITKTAFKIGRSMIIRNKG